MPDEGEGDPPSAQDPEARVHGDADRDVPGRRDRTVPLGRLVDPARPQVHAVPAFHRARAGRRRLPAPHRHEGPIQAGCRLLGGALADLHNRRGHRPSRRRERRSGTVSFPQDPLAVRTGIGAVDCGVRGPDLRGVPRLFMAVPEDQSLGRGNRGLKPRYGRSRKPCSPLRRGGGCRRMPLR